MYKYSDAWKESLDMVGRSASNPHDALVELFKSCLADYLIMAQASQDALDALKESPYCNDEVAAKMRRYINIVDSYNPYHAVEALPSAMWDWEEEAERRTPNPRRPRLPGRRRR